MRREHINAYVERFGELMNKPESIGEVEKLLLSIPDPQSFEQIRNDFYTKFKNALLPTFLKLTDPDQHIRLLIAYKKATRDYQ